MRLKDIAETAGFGWQADASLPVEEDALAERNDARVRLDAPGNQVRDRRFARARLAAQHRDDAGLDREIGRKREAAAVFAHVHSKRSGHFNRYSK